jgi:hypothetical protein
MVIQGLANIVGLGGAGPLNKNPTPYDFSKNRRIQDKSFMTFVFPTPTPLVARLPFYENIEIKESKRANITTHNPIGRNGSLYTYAGASSRVLKLRFSLTLQHIQSMHTGSKMRFIMQSEQTRDQIKDIMKRGNNPPPSEPTTRGAKTVPQTNGEGHSSEDLTKASSEPTNWVKYVSWWVNLIRSSVMSNQLNTMEGPPIIRLTHGELYQNVPCICHSYDISYDKNAGMDVATLLNRRIEVSMQLEEFRAGNFGKFDRSSKQILDRDNVAGWEAVIAYSTTDPGHEPIELSYGALDSAYIPKSRDPEGIVTVEDGGV